MLFSLSPDSKLHTRVNEKRDRERHGVVWGETIFCRGGRTRVGPRRVAEGGPNQEKWGPRRVGAQTQNGGAPKG